MKRLYFAPVLGYLLILLISGAAIAEDSTESPMETVGVSDLIKDLDADDFATREKASTQLRDAGAEAIEPLIEAAQGDSREVTIRALDILKNHAAGDDTELKEASLEGLQKLAESEDDTVAQGAKAAIKNANKPDEPKLAGPFGGPARIIIGGGGGGARIEMRAIAIGGKGARKVTIKNVDGNKQIEATEDGREVKITESAEGKIEMEIIEEKDGEKETKKYEAKNAEELKTIHPDAHKIYEKYNKGGGGFGAIKVAPIRIGPGGAFPRAIPALPAVPRPALPGPDADARMKEAMERIEKVRARMEARIKAQENEAEGDRVEALEKALDQLEKAKADIQRQLEEAKDKAEEE